MVKRELIERVGELGFQLFDTEKPIDANLVLADVVKSSDLRLWEGFPLVLANSEVSGLFDYDKTKYRLKKSKDRFSLDLLVALSLALYECLGLKFTWMKKLSDFIDIKLRKKHEYFLNALRKGMDFEVGRYKMSSERLKSTFNNYFAKESFGLNELLHKKEELDLEYALSQVFSPKQKDLFLKKLKGEKLTKTEKEYFSRAVKKKVLALANSELHRLSVKLLE